MGVCRLALELLLPVSEEESPALELKSPFSALPNPTGELPRGCEQGVGWFGRWELSAGGQVLACP